MPRNYRFAAIAARIGKATGASGAMLVMLTAIITLGVAFADAVGDFYKGRVIDLYIGYSVGGAYDLYARVIGRHLGAHIPGNPTLVPKNLEGAGSLRLANYLYRVAPHGGSAIGTIGRGIAFDPLLIGQGDAFDAQKFNWIGSANNEVSVCVAMRQSGIGSFEDLLTKDLTVGGTGASASQILKMMFARNVMGRPYLAPPNVPAERVA